MTEGSTNHSLLPANSKLPLKCLLPSSKMTKRASFIILRVNTKTGYVSKEIARETASVSWWLILYVLIAYKAAGQ